MLSIFYVLVFHPHILFGEVSNEAVYPVFNWIVCFLAVEFGELFIYSGYKSFVGYVFCKCILQFRSFSFHPLDMFFGGAKVF